MATGRDMQLTKQIGEYLVAAELCRRRLTATTFTGNVPWYDIVALDGDQNSITIQVKTITGGTWQFDASKFVELVFVEEEEIQVPKSKKPCQFPNMIYALVQLVDTGKDNFFLMYHREFHNLIYNNYCSFLEKKDGKRPRNWKSTHTALSPTDIEAYRDNWDIVKEELNRVKT